MTVPLADVGTQMVRNKMSRIADGANITGITLFGIAAADLQMVLNIIAVVLGIIATSITIGIHVWRALKERQN